MSKLADTARAARAQDSRAGALVPFRHDLFEAFRSAAPVLMAGLVLMCVLVPVSTSMVSSVSVFNINFTHDQLKYQFYAQDLAPAVNAACVLLGAVLALALFRFLLEKRSTTAYFSLNLTRANLYTSRALVGLVCIVLAVGIPFIASLVLNCVALGLYQGELAACAFVAAGYIAVALASFAVTAIVTLCAGTLFEAVAFAVALLGGVSVLLWGVGTIDAHLLVGNAMGATMYGQDATVAPSLLESLSWLNPVAFFLQEGTTHQFFQVMDPVYFPSMGNVALVAGWITAYAVLSVLGALLMGWRAGEQAEMAGKSPVLTLVSVGIFGLAVVAGAVFALGSIDIWVALAAAAALFVLVSLVLLFGPFRGRASARLSVAFVGGELAAMVAGVVVIATGGLGYAGYIPGTADVKSVEVSYVGSPSFLTQKFSGVSGGASYYFTSNRTYTDADAIESIRSVHGQLIASARSAWATDRDDFQGTVVPYDVVLRYRLNDGTTVDRYYRQATVGELSALRSLDNDAHARELRRAVVTGRTDGLSKAEVKDLSSSQAYTAFRSGALYAADGLLNKIVPVTLTTADRAELEDAMAQDLQSLNASEIYSPSGQTRAALMFSSAPEVDVASFGYSFNNAVVYVTDAWANTMAWLQAHGVMAQLNGGELDARVIENLVFQADDPYASVNAVTSPQARYFMGYRRENAGAFWVTQDFGAQKTVSETDKIAQVLPNLRLGAAMDGGYLVQAKLRGIDAYVYFYLPAELAPDYL